jgi:hypothetical protein
MKSLLALALLPVLLFASNIDPLYDFDYARIGVKGFYITGGVEANLDNAMYDKDGKKVESVMDPTGQTVDYAYKSTDIWVPIRVGYSFNEVLCLGLVAPLASLTNTATTGGVDYTETNTAFGNPWVWVKGSFIFENNFRLSPRLGIKAPLLAYTMEDQAKDRFNDPTAKVKAITGDKNLAFDLGVVLSARPDTNPFRLDSQLAFRYSVEGTYSYQMLDTTTGTAVDVETRATPGAWVNLRVMPGMAFGVYKNIETYLWLEYAMKLTEDKATSTVDGNPGTDTSVKGGSMFTAGVRGVYAVDPDNMFELKFLYDVMTAGGEYGSTGVSYTMPAGMAIGLGYYGYLPM